MNERLTGRPHAWPIGTLMLGYPATAAGVLLPPVKWSPLTGSVGQAGLPVGATMASSLCLFMTASSPWRRARRPQVSSALRYAGVVRSPLASARTKSSWPNQGISRARSRSLNAITSASVRTGAAGPSAAR